MSLGVLWRQFYQGTVRESAAPLVPSVALINIIETISTSNADPRTFSVTVDASAKGIGLIAIADSATDFHVDGGVTIGGVAMPLVTKATDTLVEPGTCKMWFVGSGLPAAGSQTVSVDMSTASLADFPYWVFQLSGGGDLEVVDSDIVQEDAANPSVTLSYGGRRCITVGGIYHGTTATPTPNGNMTAGDTYDFTNRGGRIDYQTTPGTSDFTFGYTSSSDDVAMVAACFSEVGS